jgi:methyl-accepting chemotaxis protein
MNEPQKFQRRTVLVKQSLQLKYVALVFVSVLVGSFIVGADIYYSVAKSVLAENPSLEPVVMQFNRIILVKMALYMGIMFLVSLYISHRFAGPIYRFEKSAQIVSSGDLTHRVSLRTGDELMELQEEFNGMVASLQGLIQKDRTLAERLKEKLAAAQKSLEAGRADGAREELKALAVELGHLTQSFKV